ncbi:MAG: terminase small subunit [Betaproteobacteria bacterium]|nr:terminase small subunit [Betaproteobacteria bacterium]
MRKALAVRSTKCENQSTMTPRQHRFVSEYLVDRDGADAAVRAGYSVRSAKQIAYQPLAKPDVAEGVQSGEARVAAMTELTRERVLTGLREAVALARERQEPTAMITAWREIGKLIGAYAPRVQRVELSAAGYELRARYDVMTDDELVREIERA